MSKKPKIIVIVGPTSSGKSDLSVELARKFNGEVISADSRQVYKGLNIGTGKITEKEMRGIPHHLLDVADPKKIYTASDFKNDGAASIVQITRSGKMPIVCGGTGFYISTLLGETLLPVVPPNKKLRHSLSKKTPKELSAILKKLDHKRFREIDQNNLVRLIRAIEIAKALGKVPSIRQEKNYDVLKIGLDLPQDELKKRIHLRLIKRFKQGMIVEAKKLHRKGLSWKRMEELGLEYRSCAKFLKGEISREEMIQKLETEIWHYAKRQLTWFKKDKEIIWFNPKDTKRILKTIKNFLS